MSTIRRITATLGATVALCVIGAGAAAGSPVPGAEGSPAVHVGAPAMDVRQSLVNDTPYHLTLTQADQTPGLYGPPDGWFPGEYPSEATIPAGGGATWGITNWLATGTLPWTVGYDVTDSAGRTDTVTMTDPGGGIVPESCRVSGPTAGDWTCSLDGNQATLLPSHAG